MGEKNENRETTQRLMTQPNYKQSIVEDDGTDKSNLSSFKSFRVDFDDDMDERASSLTKPVAQSRIFENLKTLEYGPDEYVFEWTSNPMTELGLPTNP